MDRLNQLRGDAGPSRDSSLDTSSLMGDAYTTANDSSKYFSISEVDSSGTVCPSKEAEDDVTADSCISHAERIISNLSPIPKKSELNNFKIGEQIEAANILSGGVNIFDDNENSYDGDELVIDVAAAEGDEKSSDVKLSENADVAFDKTDRLPDTSMEDAEVSIPSKDTEVVLQIDGKNVDAIDIGNGLYLYRKDGEEELAAVQILDDNQQQPDIKFLKVRENAEGNLEVYEEIEIEVPKEVPTKEGKAVRNTSQIPVKDVHKVNESSSNKVAEKESQASPKDTTISEVELDMTKDNAHVESKTEVNLNGKMMKFSESRKSPLIGSFTPMTYHSTPNKEGIPLTKTMVDLQLHPNRHSENVKKTIEVHTDNCKQRLLDTPTKITKDSNEHNKSLDFVSSSLDKNHTINVIVDKADQSSQVKMKDVNKALIENKTDEVVTVKVNEDIKNNINKSENQQTKVSNKSDSKNTVIDEKTKLIDIKSLRLEKSSVSVDSPCKTLNDEVRAKALMIKTPVIDMYSKTRNEIIVTEACDEFKDGTHKEFTNKKHTESKKAEDIKIDDDRTTRVSIVKENEMGGKVKNTDNVNAENKSNVTTGSNTVSCINVSENPLKSIKSIINNSTEKNNDIQHTQNDLGVKDISKIKQFKNNSAKTVETSPKLYPNQEVKQLNKCLETLGTLTKCVKLVTDTERKNTENQPSQSLKSLSEDVKIRHNTVSELNIAEKEMEMLIKNKPFQEESGTALKNIKASENKLDSLLSQPGSSMNMSNKLRVVNELKTVPDLKRQETECKINMSRAAERQTNTDLNSFKHENKLVSFDTHSSKNLKGDDITKVKAIEIESKNEPLKLSKELVKKVNAKSNQLEMISPKVTDVFKSVPKTESDNLCKDSRISEQSYNRNSLLNLKSSTPEKIEVNQKSHILYKNTKVSLLTSDLKHTHAIQNLPNEVQGNKNDSKKDSTKISKVTISKPINNNKAAVPFGKWTEANRQEFLNKIKESKVPINTSNTKQLKQPNDLNRRDILQKIDSQRQSNIASTKVQEFNILNKNKLKHETPAFMSKPNVIKKDKLKDNNDSPSISKIEDSVSTISVENTTADKKINKEHPLPLTVDMSNMAMCIKKDSVQRKEINNQDLIDKTIEGIINRAVTAKLSTEDVKQDAELVDKPQNATSYAPVSLDEIESKMNELHGIPFVERPPHELPKVFEHENKNIVTPDASTASKSSELSTALPFTNKVQQNNEHKTTGNTKINEESDEEIIEHEPETGDKELNKNNVLVLGLVKDKIYPQESITTKVKGDSKKEPIITENDFDKFARRNSITYENCLTVNFDGKEHHNVVQTVVEREVVPKKLSRNEIMLAESKAKSHKQLAVRHINFTSKIPTTTKTTQDEDSYNKNYQSKVQIAYQSVMSTKRQQECPITIIEDKPVKVEFVGGNHEYIPHQLNVQGKELSPPKKSITEWDHFTHSNSESLDSDILDGGNDNKSQDDIKFKSKHQRKQVLTPVEAPEIELIEPGDLGIEISPKKKRKVEDNKSEKNIKSLVPKKSYLLNRNIMTNDATSNSQDSTKTQLKESVKQQDVFVKHSDPISAIDNLVKAAELLETQSESKCDLPPNDQISLIQQNSPVKRGRGRPRKYPLSEPVSDKNPSPVKTPTPQKKPRLIDAKIQKRDTESEDDEVNSDGEFVKENWTMGKINENIICPICNKLFRSENVVFKHVKHCTGPSPSRSDSDKRSPRRMRESQEFDWKSDESKSDSMELDEDNEINKPTKKRKSKEKRSSSNDKSDDKTDVIIIEDTPTKDRDSPIRRREKLKHEQNKTVVKAKVVHESSSLVCEFCGKTFRQLSYLVNHRLQHKNIVTKKSEKEVHKSLFSCEICKKDFRKLHHLVQHRNIHNSSQMRSSRKSSSEQNDNKTTKDATRATEDQSAGFRCEPCDKSFRKLHHLVEHRETHDEINKKCVPVTGNTVDTAKPTPLHHCDICKKTFKKFQHLIEHKEHHLETSSEKSDDKSVKSSLSTKDIIHECPLCYMVFPNEHSLNKHHIICQRKKKQSAAKQAKQMEDNDTADIDDDDDEVKIMESGDENQLVNEHKIDGDTSCVLIEEETCLVAEKKEIGIIELEKPLEHKKEQELENHIKPTEVNVSHKPEMDRKLQTNEKHTKSTNKKDGYGRNVDKASIKSKKYVVPAITPVDIIKISDTPTPKKKLHAKDKIGETVTKRHKTNNVPLPEVDKVKTPDSSDDDEIRYMLNPNFQTEQTNEGKMFMKIRAKKRNSLQIERPNSKDLMKRRISLQHPPKIPRLKVKPIARKPINTNTVVKSSKTPIVPVESSASTDSDDSDVKYSFPESVMKEMAKETQKKVKRQKIVEKRKSLSNIAKRKSLGKMVTVKQKVNPSPSKQIKKRTADAEHRCDCGQLFSSAALLTRHTSLAHTPPRIRRRRSPPPDIDAKPTLKRTEKPQEVKKAIDSVPKKTGVTTRKSSINSEVKSTPEVRKTPKNVPLAKTRRSAPHKGVPVPEKMRKLMDNSKK